MSTSRRAYTLLEVMLVLALIGILTALVYPSLEGMYAHYKMTAGTDAVRAAWVQARSRAIDDGRPYRFAVIPDRGNFRVAPDAADFWNGGNGDNGDNPDEPPLVLEDALPNGVRFAPPGEDFAPGEPVKQTVLTAEEIAPNAWTKAAVFLPDGTTLDDVNVILHGAGKPQVVRLRSLTGVITARPLSEGVR